MCDAYLIVWTCVVYALASVYVFAFAAGYHNAWVCCILYVSVAVALGFQIASSCALAYVNVGAALFALMQFTWCAGVLNYLREVCI